MTTALLTAVESIDHVHLIIGSNPLAGARCSKAVEVGAHPKLLAPANATLHYGLMKRIEAGEVEWVKKELEDDDLTRLGRGQVDHVVDAVFVTLGAKHPASKLYLSGLQRYKDR